MNSTIKKYFSVFVRCLLLVPALFVFPGTSAFAQVKVLYVQPEQTDATITTVHSPHVAMYDPQASPQHRLLLFINGTLNGAMYRDIAERTIIPALFRDMAETGTRQIFVDDNAPAHRCATASEVFERYDAQRVWWPASSPDPNPIENLWAFIKAKLSKDSPRPTNLPELASRIEYHWRSIPPAYCVKLIESMPGRIKELRERKGWYTSK